LQGEISTPPPEKEGPPPGFETNTQDKENTKCKMKNNEIPSQDTEGSQTKESETERGKELETTPEIIKDVPEKNRRNNINRARKSYHLLYSIAVKLWNPPMKELYMSMI
jgi:hypothetical protein